MAYKALARTYRPQTFRDILGQESIVRTLQNAIEQKRIHQAYLLSGVRGVGKTTTARIFAKALNCIKGPTAEPCNECSACREITEGIALDVREIDAATYTQVDNIRELREVTQFQPARDRNRIFIIDEAHMLSSSAWNALLKLIEEPPPHVVFIMATTEMHKVPATILSRVQQLVFRKITPADVAERLAEICRTEKIDAEPAALMMIARRGEGSVRDSLSVLDQVVAFSGSSISAADVATILGLSDKHFFARLVSQIREGHHAAMLETLEEAAESGRDFKLLYRDFLGYLRNLLLIASGASESLVTAEAEDLASLREIASGFRAQDLLRILNVLIQDDELIAGSEHQRIAVEIAILKAATFPRMIAVEKLLSSGVEVDRTTPKAISPSPAAATVASPDSTIRRQPATAPEIRGGGDIRQQLLDRIRTQRRVTASYLEQAKRMRQEDEVLIFEFEAAQSFMTDYLSAPDQIQFLEAQAREILGAGAVVRIELQKGEANSEKKDDKARLQEDPIIQALQKHLGGEVVPPRKRPTEAQ